MSTRSDFSDSDIDVASLILARNDTHPDGDWWYDPDTGTCLYYGIDDDADLPALRAGHHVVVPTEPQPVEDIEEFLSLADRLGVDDATIMDLFQRSRGKGGLRRFRDRVGTTAAADAWAQFVLAREGERALRWLAERDLVDPSLVDTWRAQHRRHR